MEFIAGMIVGAVLTLGAVFGFKFYTKTNTHESLLAESLGKDFDEKPRLVVKAKGK